MMNRKQETSHWVANIPSHSRLVTRRYKTGQSDTARVQQALQLQRLLHVATHFLSMTTQFSARCLNCVMLQTMT